MSKCCGVDFANELRTPHVAPRRDFLLPTAQRIFESTLLRFECCVRTPLRLLLMLLLPAALLLALLLLVHLLLLLLLLLLLALLLLVHLLLLLLLLLLLWLWLLLLLLLVGDVIVEQLQSQSQA